MVVLGVCRALSHRLPFSLNLPGMEAELTVLSVIFVWGDIPYHWSCRWQSADLNILGSGLFLGPREDVRFRQASLSTLPFQPFPVLAVQPPQAFLSHSLIYQLFLQIPVLFLISSFLFHMVA